MSDRSNPDPFVIQKSRTMNKRVKLNVGGIRHEIILIIMTRKGWCPRTGEGLLLMGM